MKTIAVISMIRDAWGGSEELWAAMADVAQQQGHRVVHVSIEHPDTHPKMSALVKRGMVRLQRPGYIPPQLNAQRRWQRMGINYLRKAWDKTFASLDAIKPDVVLYNGTCYSIATDNTLRKWLLRSSTPVFYLGHYVNDTIREINDDQASTVRDVYKKSRRVFFTSDQNRRSVERQLCIRIPHAEIIRNPVNLNDVSTVPFPHVSSLQLACVANLVTRHKGQDILIEALSGCREIPWVLNLYGSGLDEKYLKDLVAHLGLGERVRFHGRVSDIRAVWAENRMLVLPSHMEGMPLAVVEAMLCARPCLVTDVGGNREWIEDGVTGFIAEGTTVAAIQRTLQRAFDEQSRWEAMGGEAHTAARLRFDPQAGASLLQKLIGS